MNLYSFIKGNRSYRYGFPFLLLVLLFVSCNELDASKVDLLFGAQYHIGDEEVLIEKNNLHIEDFKKLRDSLQLSDIALYKVLKHPDYITYIAMDAYDTGGKAFVFKSDTLLGRAVLTTRYRTKIDKNLYAVYYSLSAKNNTNFNDEKFKNRFEKK